MGVTSLLFCPWHAWFMSAGTASQGQKKEKEIKKKVNIKMSKKIASTCHKQNLHNLRSITDNVLLQTFFLTHLTIEGRFREWQEVYGGRTLYFWFCLLFPLPAYFPPSIYCCLPFCSGRAHGKCKDIKYTSGVRQTPDHCFHINILSWRHIHDRHCTI